MQAACLPWSVRTHAAGSLLHRPPARDQLAAPRHGLAGWRGLMEPETKELFGNRLIAFTEVS